MAEETEAFPNVGFREVDYTEDTSDLLLDSLVKADRRVCAMEQYFNLESTRESYGPIGEDLKTVDATEVLILMSPADLFDI